MIAICSRCTLAIDLCEGRATVNASGRVVQFCATCWPQRDTPLAPVATAPEPMASPRPSTRPAWPNGRRLAAGAALVAAAALAVLRPTPEVEAALPAAGLDEVGLIEEDVSTGMVAAEALLPPATPPVPTPRKADGTVDLGAIPPWIHPVTDAAELVPVRGTRSFGAERRGVERSECGRGHCGLDLDGPRGRTVVAVAPGQVVRVEHSRDGRDGRSGRYVRIAHADGLFTSYMHLDAVAAELVVGDQVVAGQVLGTLGKSGIRTAAPHLHFSLEATDAHGRLRYVDPSHLLVTADFVPDPVRVSAQAESTARANW